MSAFHGLHERLRHGIVHTLGWRELRPVQELALQTLLAGRNAVILAPTAGGKTEAALLPAVEILLREPTPPVGVLFLSPLRALLNNQEPRVAQLAGLGGRRAFKWHGDVGSGERRHFLEEPADVLMTTPESLEVMLMSGRAGLFRGLRVVVVDEIHAFAGDPRGDHLCALLERLRAVSGDFQRVGLSATVGDPEVLLEWLQGSSRREGEVVRPPSPRVRRRLEIHPVEEPAPVAAGLARGRKTLVFCESRRQVEKVRSTLETLGVRAFPHHASLSRELREEAEEAFRREASCCIVCTRTMELGLDVGDLDAVLQIDAPNTVSAFLQRLGRTGRRAGSVGHVAFLTDREESFLLAIALVSLALRGWVEPVAPSRRAAPVFVHQVLARSLEEFGIPWPDAVGGAGEPYCFRGLLGEERERIVRHLVDRDILALVDGLLVLGPEGERQFGHSHFRDLYSVFESPAELRVQTTRSEDIGTLETWFARTMSWPFVFVLGGRAWEAVEVDWDRSVLTARPARSGRIPSWSGTPRLLSREICEEIRALLVGTDSPAFLDEECVALLQELRSSRGERLRSARLLLDGSGRELVLETYAGGRINLTLSRLAQHLHPSAEVRSGNYSVRLAGPSARPLEDALAVAAAGIGDEVARALVTSLDRGRLSKFQPWLPPSVEAGWLAEQLLDLAGAAAIARS